LFVVFLATFLDYIRHYGEDGISGVHFVGAITKLGSDEAMSVLTPEFLNLVPGFFAMEVEESVAAWSRCCECASSMSPQPQTCT